MSKRSVFTTITPLPPGVTRETAIAFLQNHLEMIDLNPLVKERHPIKPPPHASPEEFHCVWYSLTDKISYLPGGLVTGDVSYTCAFHDLPNGLQTHCYAPMGLDIRDKWTVNGSLPGEPVQPVELGIGAPLTGLYIREDVDMRCNFVMTNFVKKTLKKAHSTLIERLKVKAQIATAATINASLASQGTPPMPPMTSAPNPAWVGPLGSPQPPYGYPQPLPPAMAPPPGSPHGSEFAVPHQPGGSPGYPAYAHPAGPTSAAAGAGRDATGRVSWSALKPNPSVSSRHSGGSAPGTDDSQPPLPPLPVQHTGSSYGTATPAPGAPSQTPPPPGYTYDGKPMPMNTMYPQHTGPYPPSQQLPGHYPPHAGHYPPPQQYGPPMGHMGYPQQHVMPQQQQPRAVPPQPAEGGQKAELVGSDGQKKDNQFIAELE